MSPAEGGILHFVITLESETDPSLRILPSVYKNIDVLIATQSAQFVADAVSRSKAHVSAPRVAIEKKKRVQQQRRLKIKTLLVNNRQFFVAHETAAIAGDSGEKGCL